jgi:hypothetical protein
MKKTIKSGYKIILVLGVFVFIAIFYIIISKTQKNDEWFDKCIYDSCLNMVQIFSCIKNEGTKEKILDNKEVLLNLYKNENIGKILISPFMASEKFYNYHDKFVSGQVENKKIFNEMCGYLINRNQIDQSLMITDKYYPYLKIKESSNHQAPNYKELHSKYGGIFKIYGVPKNSPLRKLLAKELFAD